MPEDMIQLKNVNDGVGNTRMACWKYEMYREAILKAVPVAEPGILFKDLPAEVDRHLPAERRGEVGKLTWHVTSVKLDLEARGLIRRIAGSRPQRLIRITE